MHYKHTICLIIKSYKYDCIRNYIYNRCITISIVLKSYA